MRLTASVSLLIVVACGPAAPPLECPPTEAKKIAAQDVPAATAARGTPSVAEALAFVQRAEARLLELWRAREQASWVKNTFITYDSEVIAAKADEAVMEYVAQIAPEAARFDTVRGLPFDVQRKLKLIKLSLSLPAPANPAKRAELALVASEMESIYGKGKYCPERLKGKCQTLDDLSETLAKSRKFDELLEAWKGWRTISQPMRAKYVRFVELANEGARELGFKNLGELWRSRYDMSPEGFEKEVERLWQQVAPLYRDLHCHVRAKLGERYGKDKVSDKEPIPAHLLGNMWSQSWENLFDLVAPSRTKGNDLDRTLVAKRVTPQQMVEYGERFFVSLGLDKLPKTFYERSMFVRPKDREVVCHASAWDVDYDNDLRLKMCIKINAEDFSTIHHELGHIYYYQSYRQLPTLYRDSANDGFHEAIGDTIALSVTPGYLNQVGLLIQAKADDLNPLMERALEKVAFLPFGLLIDRWRWEVFAGQTKPGAYNARFWELRKEYQGIVAPVARSEGDFDPGAKYHIPANVPYTRYFLAAVLQFQLHRALCKAAGHTGPLHTCSIYGNAAAGERLKRVLAMGLSRPWVEALQAATGETRLDGSAMLAYFKPLHDWLQDQNKSRHCGW